jgi:hypothetical protein
MNVLENISISHRLVAQQEIERQNFRVRGSGGECCISECLICHSSKDR